MEEYFKLIEDQSIHDPARPTALQRALRHGRINKENADQIKDRMIIYVPKNSDNKFLDYFTSPGILLNKKMESIIRLYQPDIVMKTITVISSGFDQYKTYTLLFPDILDCAAAESTYHRDGTIDNLVLDRSKTGNNQIFLVKNHPTQLIVTLALAESLLRRRPTGLLPKKVTVKYA